MIQFINSRINTSLSKTFSNFFQNLEECPPMEYQCTVPIFGRVGKLVMQVFEPAQILIGYKETNYFTYRWAGPGCTTVGQSNRSAHPQLQNPQPYLYTGILAGELRAGLILMQGLVEQEISYRWFRTSKNAEDWCVRRIDGPIGEEVSCNSSFLPDA